MPFAPLAQQPHPVKKLSADEKSVPMFQSIKIKQEDAKLCVGRKNEYTTLAGIPINLQPPPAPFQIQPHLSGQYIIDFFYILKSKTKKNIPTFLIQTDKNNKEIRKIALSAANPLSVNDISRFQEQLDLEKSDSILISAKDADFGFIGEPTFYKPGKENKKPHFVFIIVADTLRWDFLGTYNKEKKCSPHIDAFAKDAAVFTQAYSTAPWTLPAHASMFTGLFPNNHHVNFPNKDALKNNKILFDLLKKKFLIYGITDSHFVSAEFGFHQGFDYYTEYKKAYNDRTAAMRTFSRARKMILAEKSNAALFFLHSYQVHSPYVPELDLADEYYSKSKILHGLYKFNAGEFVNQGKDLYKKIPAQERTDIEKVYEAGVYTFDHRFGQFITFLKRQNIYRDSLIILLSDHGEEFMDHGGWEHGHSLYNELIKIPLLVKFPGNSHAGQEVNSLVCITDILPTIMDIEGIRDDESRTAHLDGVSLLLAVRGDAMNNRKLIACLAAKVMRKANQKIAAISANLKFIYYDKMSPKEREFYSSPPPTFDNEMFDIYKDPGDKHNIILEQPIKTREFLDFTKTIKLRADKKKVPKKLMEDLKTLGYL
jgi:arylsulfatase A-like enzyme